MLRLPARSCSPSTFCVMSVKRGERSSMRAKAKCPALGFTFAMTLRRQLYHSQLSSGLRANAAGVAKSSGRWLRHSPPGPRNVGTPLSAEMPAPVRTATDDAAFSHWRAICQDSTLYYKIGRAHV